MREAAKERLAKAADLPRADMTELASARADREQTRKALQDLEVEARSLDEQMAFFENMVVKARSEIPGFGWRASEREQPGLPRVRGADRQGSGRKVRDLRRRAQ